MVVIFVGVIEIWKLCEGDAFKQKLKKRRGKLWRIQKRFLIWDGCDFVDVIEILKLCEGNGETCLNFFVLHGGRG